MKYNLEWPNVCEMAHLYPLSYIFQDTLPRFLHHIVFIFSFLLWKQDHPDQHEKQNCTFSWVCREEVNIFYALLSPGDVTGQFTAAPPTCPGDTFTFTCTVTEDTNGVTLWRVGGSSVCALLHSIVGASSYCGPGSAFIATPGTGFGTSATSFSSTLSGIAISELNGTLVECFGPDLSRDAENRVGGNRLQIVGQ